MGACVLVFVCVCVCLTLTVIVVSMCLIVHRGGHHICDHVQFFLKVFLKKKNFFLFFLFFIFYFLIHVIVSISGLRCL